jgi:hypothetical protein
LSVERRSGRNAGNAGKGGSSSRPPAGPGRSDRVPGKPPSPRRGAEGAPGGASARAGGVGAKAGAGYKQLMIIGTPVLLVLMIGLLVWKAPWESPPPPPKRAVIDDNVKLDEVKEIAAKAAKKFAERERANDREERNKVIRAAIGILGEAQDKLSALSEKYPDEDHNQVFEPVQNKISQELKTYREALRLD